MLDEVTIDCPYCGERFVTMIDTSVDHQQYVEDCQVCCSPILFDLSLDTISGEFTISVRREND